MKPNMRNMQILMFPNRSKIFINFWSVAVALASLSAVLPRRCWTLRRFAKTAPSRCPFCNEAPRRHRETKRSGRATKGNNLGHESWRTWAQFWDEFWTICACSYIMIIYIYIYIYMIYVYTLNDHSRMETQQMCMCSKLFHSPAP